MMGDSPPREEPAICDEEPVSCDFANVRAPKRIQDAQEPSVSIQTTIEKGRKMREHEKILLVGLAVLAAAACYDDPLAVDSSLEDDPEAVEETQANRVGGGRIAAARAPVDPFRPRLDLTFVVNGELTPTAPVSVWLEGVALEEITGGTVRVVLPTLTGMSFAGPGKRPYYPMDREMPVVARWQLPAMKPGEEWKESVTMGQLPQGYYQIAVDVDVRGPTGDPYVIDDIYDQVWVFVQDGGGLLTPAFDMSVFPDDLAPAPGPFRGRTHAGTQMSAEAGGHMAMSSSQADISVEVVYVENGRNRPAVGSYITAIVYDEDEGDSGSAGRIESRYVPSSGIVSFTCPPEGHMLVGHVVLPATSEVGSGTFNGHWDAYRSHCGRRVQVPGTRHTYVVWKNLDDMIRAVDRHLGESRSRMEWRVNMVGQEGASYDDINDRIIFGRRTYDNKWTAAHEYAHALHEESLGGLWTAESACYDVTRRGVWREIGYSCALLEGFANYAASSVVYDRRVGNLETGRSVSGVPAKYEGRVAMLFHDLIDSAVDDGDRTSYDASDVMDVFRTCRVRVGRSWSDRNDITDFVWCAENRVNASVHADNFPGQTAPNRVSVTEPSGWHADRIRSTWEQNVGR